MFEPQNNSPQLNSFFPPSPPPPPSKPHQFPEPEDSTGRACLRSSAQSCSVGTSSVPVSPPPAPVGTAGGVAVETSTSSSYAVQQAQEEAEVRITPMVKTTQWLHMQKAATAGDAPPAKRRKYTCTTCGLPMTSTGHSQWYGHRYCPHAPGQVPKEQWMAKQRAKGVGRKYSQSTSVWTLHFLSC